MDGNCEDFLLIEKLLLFFLLICFNQYLGEGISGLQGPYYSGTGCFHRRKFLYGLWPDGCMETGGRSPNCVAGKKINLLLTIIFYYIFLLVLCLMYYSNSLLGLQIL